MTSLGGCLAHITFECEDPIIVHGKFVSFGEHDVVALAAFPDDEQAAAFSMTISAGGAVKSFRTTPLMSWPQGMAAMQEAAENKARYPSLTARRAARR